MRLLRGGPHLAKETDEAMDPRIKKNWIDLQRKKSVPVNAIGVPIDPKDQFTMKVWRDEGIDRYMLDAETKGGS